jgi:hypothetical protein
MVEWGFGGGREQVTMREQSQITKEGPVRNEQSQITNDLGDI